MGLVDEGRHQLGQTEVENLDTTVRGDEHVLRLEIAMDDALGVRGGQTPAIGTE